MTAANSGRITSMDDPTVKASQEGTGKQLMVPNDEFSVAPSIRRLHISEQPPLIQRKV